MLPSCHPPEGPDADADLLGPGHPDGGRAGVLEGGGVNPAGVPAAHEQGERAVSSWHADQHRRRRVRHHQRDLRDIAVLLSEPLLQFGCRHRVRQTGLCEA